MDLNLLLIYAPFFFFFFLVFKDFSILIQLWDVLIFGLQVVVGYIYLNKPFYLNAFLKVLQIFKKKKKKKKNSDTGAPFDGLSHTIISNSTLTSMIPRIRCILYLDTSKFIGDMNERNNGK